MAAVCAVRVSSPAMAVRASRSSPPRPIPPGSRPPGRSTTSRCATSRNRRAASPSSVPTLAKLLAALGIDPALEPLHFRQQEWRGLSFTLSRFGEHNGYEIWCEADHALYLWDRIAAAGAPFALTPAGLDAVDTLDLEAGVPRPDRDYDGAHDPQVAAPLAGELRLGALIEAEQDFNGRAAAICWQPKRRLAVIVLDSDTPAPFASLLFGGQVVGRVLSSRWSPILRRAIALAQIDVAHATAGTRLSLILPPSREVHTQTVTTATVVDLPFLSAPDLIVP